MTNLVSPGAMTVEEQLRAYVRSLIDCINDIVACGCSDNRYEVEQAEGAACDAEFYLQDAVEEKFQ